MEYKESLKEEQRDLNHRITKLILFINSPKFSEIDEAQQKLIHKQKRDMLGYERTLVMRMELLGIEYIKTREIEDGDKTDN